MTQRVSLYNEVHKGLRSELLTTLADCARTDPRDPKAVGEVADRFCALVSMLDEHAGHEERWVEPLLKDLRPDLAAELHTEHARLDPMMQEVVAALGRWAAADAQDPLREGERAHGALAAFVGAYLTHMSREEDEAMPVLHAAMDDAQLLEVSAQLRGSIAPERLAQYIAIMLPAMNVEERSAMFMGLKAGAPPPVLQGMCELAAGVLEPGDWTAVQTRVGL